MDGNKLELIFMGICLGAALYATFVMIYIYIVFYGRDD